MNDALLTGIFGVVVALITWSLAGYREKSSFKRDIQIERIRRLESLYAERIELLEMAIRITIALESYSSIERELSKSNAWFRLLSTKEINDHIEKSSSTLSSWSSLYRRGSPKPCGDGTAIMTSNDSQYSKQASETYPQLNEETNRLIELMKAHLHDERARA